MDPPGRDRHDQRGAGSRSVGRSAAAAASGEWVAGSYAAIGGLCAVLSAWNTGLGQHVDLSMFEAMLLCMTQYHDFAGQLFGTPLPQYVDTPSIEPARDGWVGFATITPQQWKDFCAMVGRPDVAEIKRYFYTDERMKDLDFIHGIIRGWTRERTVAEIVELASAMRIPVAPIGDGRSLPATDHFVAREVFEKHPGIRGATGAVSPRERARGAATPGAAPRREHGRRAVGPGRPDAARRRSAPVREASASWISRRSGRGRSSPAISRRWART